MYQQARLNYPTTLESATVHRINAQIVEVQKQSLKILKMLKYCLKLTKVSISPYFALHAFHFLCSLPSLCSMQTTAQIILPESENSQWQNQQQKAYELVKIWASLEGHTSKTSRAIKCGRLMTPLESKSKNKQQRWQCSLVIPATCLKNWSFQFSQFRKVGEKTPARHRSQVLTFLWRSQYLIPYKERLWFVSA